MYTYVGIIRRFLGGPPIMWWDGQLFFHPKLFTPLKVLMIPLLGYHISRLIIHLYKKHMINSETRTESGLFLLYWKESKGFIWGFGFSGLNRLDRWKVGLNHHTMRGPTRKLMVMNNQEIPLNLFLVHPEMDGHRIFMQLLKWSWSWGQSQSNNKLVLNFLILGA